MEKTELGSITAKILVIDDEEIVRESCTRILQSQDYSIKTADNGEMGLKILDEFHPDLVLVDLKMPGMSGFEVLEEIYAYDATIVPIVDATWPHSIEAAPNSLGVLAAQTAFFFALRSTIFVSMFPSNGSIAAKAQDVSIIP